MNYRRIAAIAAALAIMGTTFGCGDANLSTSEPAGNASVSDNANTAGGESKSSSDSSSSGSSDNKSGSSSDEKSAESSGSGDGSTSDTSNAEGDSSDTSSYSGEGGGDSAGGSSSASGGGSASSGGSSASSGGSTSSGGGSSSESSGGSSSSGGGSASSGGDNGSSSGESSTGSGSDEEEETFTAEIQLGSSPSYTGSNVSVEGSVVKITAGGDYRFTGSVSEGQIYVDTTLEEKVKLVLDGVSISNSSGPAILVYEAKECTVKVQAGSTNTLSDGGSDKVYDGVIFSNDTLTVKGGGTLNITSGNAHGIASDDDIVIDNGTINITSIKSGLFAHDDITINGGTLDIKGGTNGIKSKGSVNINGGRTTVSGGTKEEKSSIYAATTFNYTDGYVFAAGNKVTPLSSCVNPYVVVSCGSVSSNTNVKMYLNGSEMVNFTPHNNFACLLMLAPEISEGSTFGVEIGGSYTESSVGSGQNVINT